MGKLVCGKSRPECATMLGAPANCEPEQRRRFGEVFCNLAVRREKRTESNAGSALVDRRWGEAHQQRPYQRACSLGLTGAQPRAVRAAEWLAGTA